jgi:hypothetical protein
VTPRDPNDPPKPPAGILADLSPEQIDQLAENDRIARDWLADFKALAFWDCYDRNRPQ